MIAVIDYGVGNIFSLTRSLEYIGADAVVTGDPEIIKRADRLILPGVGAFADAAKKLSEGGLDKLVCAEAGRKKPLLGICLGMQLLFERSFEYGEHKGLGLIPGEIVPIAGDITEKVKVPHMGWNSLEIKRPDCKLFKNTKQGDYVYYVHSFYAKNCSESVAALSCYGGIEITGAVFKDNVYGTQFHPEKSGDVGLGILKAFCEL